MVKHIVIWDRPLYTVISDLDLKGMVMKNQLLISNSLTSTTSIRL